MDPVGLTLVKIDGIYELEVTGERHSAARTVPQHYTGAGIKNAPSDLTAASGSFDEVVTQTGGTDWMNKSKFRYDVYDKATRKIIVYSASNCDWEKIDGSSDNQSAMTKKSVSWKGEIVNKT